MKTRVYIDGANFYFGLLKSHPEWKWLDPLESELDALVKSRATPAQIESKWQTSNTRLRKLGIRLLPMPER